MLKMEFNLKIKQINNQNYLSKCYRNKNSKNNKKIKHIPHYHKK